MKSSHSQFYGFIRIPQGLKVITADRKLFSNPPLLRVWDFGLKGAGSRCRVWALGWGPFADFYSDAVLYGPEKMEYGFGVTFTALFNYGLQKAI